MAKRRLLIDISAHGFGHLSQSAAVIAALRKAGGEFDLTVRCAHPAEKIREFFPGPVALAPPPPDIGMIMSGPSRVDRAATRRAYRDLHARLPAIIAAERDRLHALAPDLVLANIPYTTLLAADAAGVPAVAFCSLNWRDILAGYVDGDEDREVLAAIADAYQRAEAFLRPAPAMPMAWLENVVSIGPIVRKSAHALGRSVSAALAGEARALVLVSLGGIASDFDLARLPQMEGVRWLTTEPPPETRQSDMTPISALGLSFLEALGAADAVVTKSGYGMFVEAAANSVRVLFAARPDWPEAPATEGWLLDNATAAGISQEALYAGDFAKALAGLLARPAAPAVTPTGADEAARFILDRLR